ncbi:MULTISPECIES: fimbrial protein [Pseudomonas]|uniref:fimbrial protein n=1 Tax=Pseudomonas TaxID=286 RepID=UPI002E808564|nr:fimbrial protein [Pseudomonas sp. Z13]
MIVKATHKVRGRLMLALLCAVLSCLSQQAHALVEGNLNCTVPGVPSGGYTFTPGQAIRIVFEGTCTVRRAFPYSAGLNTRINYMSGPNQAPLRWSDPYNNIYLYDLNIGQYSRNCLGGYCRPLPLNTVVPYRYILVGTAPQTAGTRWIGVLLGVTSENWLGYGEWFLNTGFSYTVVPPACSLSSPGSVNLRFGSISNSDLNNQMQSTTVSIKCSAQMRANVYLLPNQTVVSPTTGVTRTSLAGLNMQALWTDTLNPVNFTTPRFMQLRVGSNDVNLSFKPQLAAGQSPTGAFQSQYTLNIDYQ